MIFGFGWVADIDMQRVPETDCIAIMILTPTRILMGAGTLTTSVRFQDLTNCFWREGDFCLEAKEKELGIGGFRFEPRSYKWTKPRRSLLRQLVLRHIEESF